MAGNREAGESPLKISDIIRIIRESEGPGQVHIVGGRPSMVKMQVSKDGMSDEGLVKLLETIELHGHHGIIYFEQQGKVITWELSQYRKSKK